MGNAASPIGVHEDSMDMTFQMVYRDKRLAQTERKGLGVKNAYQQRTGQSWAFGHSYGVEFFEGDAALSHRGSNDRDQVSEMFARGEFGDDAAIYRM